MLEPIVDEEGLEERAHAYFAIPDGFILSKFITDTHTKSGLLPSIFAARPTRHANEIADRAHDFVRRWCPDPKTSFLAGSSIHFDRSFLAYHMPKLLIAVSHRMLDVSTLKVLGQGWASHDALKALERTPRHRVFPDIDDSITELRHWQSVLFRPGLGPAHGEKASRTVSL